MDDTPTHYHAHIQNSHHGEDRMATTHRESVFASEYCILVSDAGAGGCV